MEGSKSSDNCYVRTNASVRIRESWLQQSEHPCKWKEKNTSAIYLRPLYVETELSQIIKSCQSSELNRFAHTIFHISTTPSQLELLHLDLMESVHEENLVRKRLIYAEAIRTACHYLRQSYQHPISHINPYMIKTRNSIQSRNRGTPYKERIGKRRCLFSKEERMLHWEDQRG